MTTFSDLILDRTMTALARPRTPRAPVCWGERGTEQTACGIAIAKLSAGAGQFTEHHVDVTCPGCLVVLREDDV